MRRSARWMRLFVTIPWSALGRCAWSSRSWSLSWPSRASSARAGINRALRCGSREWRAGARTRNPRTPIRWRPSRRCCQPKFGPPLASVPTDMTPVETSELTASIDEQLERLLAFEPTVLPVLSLYLNTQPDQHGRDPDVKAYLQREFKSLARTWPASSPERQSFDRDVERILTYVEEKVEPAANGVAIFACSGANDFFEAIQLTTPIEATRVYAYNQPHL